ncbi:MAG TPA: sarcosine oxidase subunit gamma family protein [Acetobacteraceae bacterium]|nr:sarcosine oxidase subunit gamma family protein [Acetobacteraceae bacterium]
MAELAAVPPTGRLVLRGMECLAFGLGLPAEPCRAEGDWALWLGPDEWLLLGAVDALRRRVHDAALGRPFALVDVSHRQVGFVLRGADADALLNGAVPLDLSVAAFPPGMCTRTLFEKAEIVLWRQGAATWRIEVQRSFAPYVQSLLIAIARADCIALLGLESLSRSSIPRTMGMGHRQEDGSSAGNSEGQHS